MRGVSQHLGGGEAAAAAAAAEEKAEKPALPGAVQESCFVFFCFSWEGI